MTYHSMHSHQGMLFDQSRNDAYFNALKSIITPESIVLDLGAGLGIHGLMAAQLGAKKTYLVEPQDVIEVAKQFVKANNSIGQVECIQGRIEDITLPEKVDVIISVFTGNFLLTEDLLPSLFYARNKYLKPDGCLLPDAAVMEAVPISLPDYHQQKIGQWSETYYNLNLSLARRYAANRLYYDRYSLKDSVYLCEPQPLMNLDFTNATAADTNCQATAKYKVDESSQCHGIAGWFKIRLGNRWLSTAPNAEKNHWTPVYLPFDPALNLNKNEILKFFLNRPPYGHWTWGIASERVEQKHSTFISETLSPQTIRKTSVDYQPSCSNQGRLVCSILSYFDGKTSVQDIAKNISQTYPNSTYPKPELIRLISDLAKQYGE